MTASCRFAVQTRRSYDLPTSRVLGAAEEPQVDALADHRRHVGVGHGRGPGLRTVDQALLQAVEGLFPGDRHRVEVERLHRDAAKLGAGHAVLGAEQLVES